VVEGLTVCQGWIALAAVVAVSLSVLLVLGLARALDEAESQLERVRRARTELAAEREHLFDQVNRLQEARLDRELERIDRKQGWSP